LELSRVIKPNRNEYRIGMDVERRAFTGVLFATAAISVRTLTNRFGVLGTVAKSSHRYSLSQQQREKERDCEYPSHRHSLDRLRADFIPKTRIFEGL
jgi:hypothetical protein